MINIQVFLTGLRNEETQDLVTIKKWWMLSFICPESVLKRIDISLDKIHFDMVSFFIVNREFKLNDAETDGLRCYTTVLPCKPSELNLVYERILNFASSMIEVEAIEKHLNFDINHIEGKPEYRAILDMCVIGAFLGNVNAQKAIGFSDECEVE